MRAVTRAELERRLAAGAEVPGLKAKVVRLRWALVKERRRRRLAEEEQEGAEGSTFDKEVCLARAVKVQVAQRRLIRPTHHAERPPGAIPPQ